MPLILYSYLASEILAPFFASLLILNGVLFTGRLMQVIDLIFTLNIGFTDFIRLCAYMSPNLLLFSLPMASTMAVIIAFSRFTSDNEMIAFKAAGISLYKMLPPVILFAIVTALTTGFFSTKLIPAGSVAMKNLFIKLATQKIEKGLQGQRFSENTGDIVLYVENVEEVSKQWSGVYLSDLRDKKNPVTVLAKNGSLTPHLENQYVSLNLTDGSLHRSTGPTTQTIKFDQYLINMPVTTPKSIGGESTTQVTKHNLSQKQLLEYADQFGRQSYNGISFLIEYHKRLVLSVGCFILTLLGLPLALRSKVGSRNIGIPLGLGFFIFYYMIVTAAKGMCDNTSLPVGLIMWTPNALFSLLTVSVLIITAQEKWEAVTKAIRRCLLFSSSNNKEI